MNALDTLEEIERRVADALRAGNEDAIRKAARAITSSGLSDVLPDAAYLIRDVAPDLWCISCDSPVANPICPHIGKSKKTRKEYLGTPPVRVACLRGSATDLHKVLITDGAEAQLLLRKSEIPSWANGYDLVIEIRLEPGKEKR